MSEQLTKICLDCNVEKALSKENFYQVKSNVKWMPRCIPCQKIKNHAYKESHRKELAVAQKVYYVNNKKAQNKAKHEWYLRNKELCKKRSAKFTKNKLKTNITFKLHTNISSRIRQGINKNNNSVIDFLGYSLDELKDHLESLFEPWMSWNNYGMYKLSSWDDNDKSTWTWNIDHIIPVSFFNYPSMDSEDFRKCWALENLRPLSAKENLKKSNRF